MQNDAFLPMLALSRRYFKAAQTVTIDKTLDFTVETRLVGLSSEKDTTNVVQTSQTTSLGVRSQSFFERYLFALSYLDSSTTAIAIFHLPFVTFFAVEYFRL
jgi:hypothetical protein